MCFALQVRLRGRVKTIAFLQKNNKLMVYHAAQQRSLIWGRRPYEAGSLPLGGWCRDDLLAEGQLDCWFPQKALILIIAFGIRDVLGKVSWFKLSAGEFLQGIVLGEGDEQRVYLLITLTKRLDNFFWHWPLIVKKPRLYFLDL